jgi:hypothetical protein
MTGIPLSKKRPHSLNLSFSILLFSYESIHIMIVHDVGELTSHSGQSRLMLRKWGNTEFGRPSGSDS